MSKTSQRKKTNRVRLQRAYDCGYYDRTPPWFIYVDERNMFLLGQKHRARNMALFEQHVEPFIHAALEQQEARYDHQAQNDQCEDRCDVQDTGESPGLGEPDQTA